MNGKQIEIEIKNNNKINWNKVKTLKMEDRIEREFKDKQSNSFLDYVEQWGTLSFW